MSKRVIYTGLLLVATQLASGCCCVRQSLWRWRCAPCNGGTCAPSYRPAMPPIGSAPIASAPVFHGGADCPTCHVPGPGGAHVGGYAGPAGGMPMFGNPIPLGNPTIERSNELPNPMPATKDGKSGN
jgi:hypothetical protein